MAHEVEFEPGEVVELISGSPWMTYEGEAEVGVAKCVWFENGAKMEGTFSVTSLKHVRKQSRRRSRVSAMAL